MALSVPGPGRAQAQSASFAFDIGPRPLAQALNDFARVTGQSVVFTQGEAGAAQSPGVRGRMSADQALSAITARTGWSWQRSNAGTVTLAREAAEGPATLPEVRVNAGLVPPQSTLGRPPAPFAGGQVATGARIGALGNRNIFETPFSVVPYTRELIEEQQSRSLSDVLRNDPSVQLGQGSSGISTDDVFNIRGFLLASSATLYDGLPGLNFRSPAIELVERVEVFRGPTALVSGSAGAQGIGGMVNLIPKRAPEEPLNIVTARYISPGIAGIHADVARRFGQDNAFGLRVNLVERGGSTAVDGVGQERRVFGVAADWRGDRARVTLDADYQNDRNDGYANTLRIAPGIGVPSAPDPRNNFWQPWAFLNQEKLRGLLRGEFDIAPNWTIGASYGIRTVNERYIDTSTTIIDANGRTRQSTLNGASHTENSVVDVALRGQLETGPLLHRIALGATQTRSEFAGASVSGPSLISSLSDSVTVPLPAGFGTTPSVPGPSSVSVTRSLFLADEVSMLAGRVLLTAGLRYTQIDNRSYNDSTNVQTQRYKQDAVTPAFGIVVRPHPVVSLYANYQQGLESGGQAPVTAANAGEILAPLVADAMEAGVRVDLGRFGMTLGAFRIERSNTFTSPSTNIFAADGRQVNRGLEFYSFGELRPGLRLIGGVTYLDARATRTAGGLYDGLRPVGQPEFTTRAYLEWDTPQLPGLTLTGGIANTSRQYLDQANTQSIPAWTRLDLGARYNFNVERTPMTARLGIENLADKRYYGSVDRGSFWVAPGRTWLFSLTAAF